MENRLKNEIVGLIAAGVMVKRSSINVLHPSQKYIEKTVSQLPHGLCQRKTLGLYDALL